MKILKITDAQGVVHNDISRIWEWDGNRLELLHYMQSATSTEFWTSVHFNGTQIWHATSEYKVSRLTRFNPAGKNQTEGVTSAQGQANLAQNAEALKNAINVSTLLGIKNPAHVYAYTKQMALNASPTKDAGHTDGPIVRVGEAQSSEYMDAIISSNFDKYDGPTKDLDEPSM